VSASESTGESTGGLAVSPAGIGNSSGEILISGREIGISLPEIPISLFDLCIFLREISISFARPSQGSLRYTERTKLGKRGTKKGSLQNFVPEASDENGGSGV